MNAIFPALLASVSFSSRLFRFYMMVSTTRSSSTNRPEGLALLFARRIASHVNGKVKFLLQVPSAKWTYVLDLGVAPTASSLDFWYKRHTVVHIQRFFQDLLCFRFYGKPGFTFVFRDTISSRNISFQDSLHDSREIPFYPLHVWILSTSPSTPASQ